MGGNLLRGCGQEDSALRREEEVHPIALSELKDRMCLAPEISRGLACEQGHREGEGATDTSLKGEPSPRGPGVGLTFILAVPPSTVSLIMYG